MQGKQTFTGFKVLFGVTGGVLSLLLPQTDTHVMRSYQLTFSLYLLCSGVYVVSSTSQADPLSTFSSPIPSTTVPVADLLPGGSPLKTNGADNDVDIVGIFGNSDQDAVFPDMPEGNFFIVYYCHAIVK